MAYYVPLGLYECHILKAQKRKLICWNDKPAAEKQRRRKMAASLKILDEKAAGTGKSLLEPNIGIKAAQYFWRLSRLDIAAYLQLPISAMPSPFATPARVCSNVK